MTDQATTADVVEFARELRARASAIRNPDPANSHHDPYAQPYAPSDDVAYKLASTLGPDEALAELKRREHDADVASRTDRRETEARERRLRKHRDRERADRVAALGDITVGQRIDHALASIRLLSECDAANLEGRVTGSKDQATPQGRRDSYSQARFTAQLAVEAIETALDRAQRRQLDAASTPDRDTRLRNMRGLSCEQVAITDPEQGTPRQIRERRREMRLDELGNPLGEQWAA